ncbi:CobW family GTP-binding protein [Streptomyces tsukubensis]|uniref:Cobalamin biosynthesis protein CobW n=1 Tax=Streptomyces tsukubensis TaxID=83656 RepID=A0A1V4A4W4_9ACTN|nr:GTP-binding protein [Streptomyces tsukubensis]OON75122.1 cobalamin biosynthesis protein CobW [Streptomyces tsukubensis]QFR96129.1 GTP-binding protein [Streptomyces tsukubensis]
MSTQQIPVVVLAGFLGSGKTTLLNHLLHTSRGSRIAVIVNDFGSIEIDAMTVAGQVGSTVSLGNGCLCCAVDAGELDVYLERLTRPSARMDIIIIEASGLAEPAELVRMILASDNPHIVYGGLVEVVDAAEFEATRERHPEVERHVGIADLVVLNKTDRLQGDQRARLTRSVTQLAGGAAVVTASYGRIDPELLFERRPVGERVGQLSFDDLRDEVSAAGQEPGEAEAARAAEAAGGPVSAREAHDHAEDSAHTHSAYESVAFTSDRPLDPRRFMSFLDSRPAGLYRIKGFADFGRNDPLNRYALHAVGRFLRFYPEPWASGARRLTQLVLIGSDIDTEAIGAELAACVAPAPSRAASSPAVSRSDIAEGPNRPDGEGVPGRTEHAVPDAGALHDAVPDDALGEETGSEDEVDGGRAMWGVLRYVQQAADPEEGEPGSEREPEPDQEPEREPAVS